MLRATAVMILTGIACTRTETPPSPPAATVAVSAVSAPPIATLPAPAALRIVGLTDHAMHTHGGDPARVTVARFEIENTGDVAQEVTLDGVDFLSDHGVQPCTGPATTFRKKLATRGVRLGGSAGDFASSVVVPFHAKSVVEVGFDPAEAYYSYCDTFGFRAHFRTGGGAVTAVANLKVSRVDPVRPRP